jgi:hypothetical protein
MKKFMLIVLAFVLVLGSCASSGGGGGTPAVDTTNQWWFIARDEGGLRARNNQVNLVKKGENFVYVYFRNSMPGADFEKLVLDYTMDQAVEVYWQCVYQPGAVFFKESLHAAPASTSESATIETDVVGFDKNWFNISDYDSAEKSEINGVCLKVVNPSGDRISFTMNSVEFVGLQKEIEWQLK